MDTTEEVNKFIEENTDPAFGTWHSYVRTRDALNISLARMKAAEERAAQLEAELATARRALAQHQQTRAELLDTIAALKAENEQLAEQLKKLEDREDNLFRSMLGVPQ